MKTLLLIISLIITFFGLPTQGILAEENAHIDYSKIQLFNYRYFGNVLRYFPGIWINEPGQNGQISTFALFGARSGSTPVFFDNHPIRDPWSGRIDLNFFSTAFIGLIHTIDVQDNSLTGYALDIHSHSRDLQKPITHFIFRSGPLFNDLDVTFGRKLSNKLNVQIGVFSKSAGMVNTPDRHTAEQMRAKFNYKHSDKLAVDYQIIDTKLNSELLHSLPALGDTAFIHSPQLKQYRTDHMVTLKSAHIASTPSVLRYTHSVIRHGWHGQSYPQQRLISNARTLSFNQQIKISKTPVDLGFTGCSDFINDFSQNIYHSEYGYLYLKSLHKMRRGITNKNQISIHMGSNQTPVFRLSALFNADLNPNLNMNAKFSQGIREPVFSEKRGLPAFTFYPQSIQDIFLYQNYHLIKPNLKIRPELSNAFHLSANIKNLFGFSVQLSGFANDVKNLIYPEFSDSTIKYNNSQSQFITGSSISFSRKPEFGFWAGGAFNYQHLSNADNDVLPKHPSLYGWLKIGFKHPFFKNDFIPDIMIGIHFWSNYETIILDDESHSFHFQPAGFLLNAKAHIIIMKYAQLSFEIDNILQNQISITGNFPLPSRTVRIGVDWILWN